jgi:hypothetical protein
MNIIFPTIAYITPGTHQCAGGTYTYREAATPAELEQLLDEGWFLTLPEAIAREHDESRYEPELDVEATSLPTPEPISEAAIVSAWLSAKLNEFGIEHEDGMTEEELLFLICSGFAGNLDDKSEEETVAPGADPSAQDDKPTGSDEPPTREELEAKATELEIKFDGRTTDKSLAEKIEFVLSEQGQ